MKNKPMTRTINDQNKGGLKPKLQFPKFRDAPAWEETKLEDLISTITPPKKLPTSDYLADGLFPIIDQSQAYLCGWTNDDAALVKDSSPLVVFGDHTCVLKLATQPFAQGADGIKIFKATRGVTTKYLYHFLNFRPLAMEDYKRHFSILKERRVFYSDINLGEQQTISDCLSSLDEVIAVHKRKLDALKAHKKGLMQQLFPREGETLPRLRFPEFRGMPEWEEKVLMNVVKSVKTGKLDANAMVEDGEFRFYTCAKNYHRIDKYAFDGEALLIAGNGAYLGYIHHYIGKFNAYQRTYVLQDFDINVTFLKYFLDRNLPARINLEKKDGNTPYIVLGTITEMPLLIPKDKDEQQKIADCLSFVDELIDAQTQNLAATMTHKKGLMQQLFPSPEEVDA